MIRFGIIGLGMMGKFHANLFRENKIQGAQLTAVSDSDEQKLQSFSGIKQFRASEDLISSGEVDAVLIATPHYSHTSIGIDALNKGLHVLVEKPIAVHKADAEKLLAAHKNKKQVFAVMFNLRTDSNYQKIKKLIADGELGEIQRTLWIITDIFRSEAYYASGTWRATWKGEGGGVLLNQCPHFLDLFQWICGMPVRLRGFCHLGKYHNIEVEDEVTAYLEYPNKATGIFMVSTGEAPGAHQLEIAGDKGKIVYENNKLLFYKNDIPTTIYNKTTDVLFGKPNFTITEIPVEPSEAQHQKIIQNFIDSILKGVPLIAPAEEGIKSLEFGNAILYSSLIKNSVDLPIDGQVYETILYQLIKESKFKKNVKVISSGDINKSFSK